MSVNIATFNLLSENSEKNALNLSIPPEGQTIHCQPNEVSATKLQRLFKAHVNSILGETRSERSDGGGDHCHQERADPFTPVNLSADGVVDKPTAFQKAIALSFLTS